MTAMIDPERDAEPPRAKDLREARSERAGMTSAGAEEPASTAPQKPREVVVLWGRCGFVPSELAHEGPQR